MNIEKEVEMITDLVNEMYDRLESGDVSVVDKIEVCSGLDRPVKMMESVAEKYVPKGWHWTVMMSINSDRPVFILQQYRPNKQEIDRVHFEDN